MDDIILNLEAKSACAKSSPAVKDFYKGQVHLLTRFRAVTSSPSASPKRELKSPAALEAGGAEETKEHGDASPPDSEESATEEESSTNIAVKLSFFANWLLLFLKVAALLYSGSTVVLVSAVDSFLDILSGAVVYFTAKAADEQNPMLFPVGKKRFEPLGVVIFSIVMAMAAQQMVMEAIGVLLEGEDQFAVVVDAYTIGMVVLVVSVKAGLLYLCKHFKSSSAAQALAQDHLNDCLTNTVSAAALLASVYLVWWSDAAGAILLSVYLVWSWIKIGWEHMIKLVGQAADPACLSEIIYLAANFHESITHVDTVRAYHVGLKLLVELDVVLPEMMPLKEAHDIGEGLQRRVEGLVDVERCFVHLDYETEHNPCKEHL